MRATIDTNVLIRAITGDDPESTALAHAALADAERIALPLPMLCEFVWVLRAGYGYSRATVAQILRDLIDAETADCDRTAIALGLALLDRGGDFADAGIAQEGARMGGGVFVSFDRKAVRLLAAEGVATKLLATQSAPP